LRSRITSYINNLHPQKYKNLYDVIEKIIACTIPLWNATLTPLNAEFMRATVSNRIYYGECKYDPDPESLSPSDGPQQEDGEEEWEYDQRREQWIHDTRQIVQPEPGRFRGGGQAVEAEGEDSGELWSPTPLDDVDLRRDFTRTGLQVIVKLANIHLTPDKPNYAGGSWHVEGQMVSLFRTSLILK
jgi:hypothetical protein